MLDKWNKIYEGKKSPRYGYDDTTYSLAAKFLDGHGDVVDWGCGLAYAKKFFKKSRYKGIDGSDNKSIDEKIDLVYYNEKSDCILIRHVLGHNFEWRKILMNAVGSFKKRMVVVLFVPMEKKDRLIYSNRHKIPVLAISRHDFEKILNKNKCKWRYQVLRTRTEFWLEHIYFIER